MADTTDNGHDTDDRDEQLAAGSTPKAERERTLRWASSTVQGWGERCQNRLAGVRPAFGTAFGYGRGVAAGIADLIHLVAGLIVSTVVGFLIGLLKIVPKSEALWRPMVDMGLRGMHKSGGGDIIGIVARPNGIDLRPMKWKPGDPDDPEDHPRWVDKAGNWWGPGAEGRGFERLGRTPVALFDEDAQEKGSFIQSRFAEALDLGHKDALFVPDVVNQINVLPQGDGYDSPGEEIADGGVATQEYTIQPEEWSDRLADTLVDLRSPDDASGMRVSAYKFKEVYQENVGSEEMQMQEFRGRAAEADPKKARDTMFRVLKYILIAVLAARAPETLSLLMGETGMGNAMNDINPFVVLPHLPDALVVML